MTKTNENINVNTAIETMLHWVRELLPWREQATFLMIWWWLHLICIKPINWIWFLY